MKERVMLVHSTTVAFAGRGVMLRGPSGSGKSELALRLMEQSGTGLGRVNLKANLIADDQTEVFERKSKLWVRCPKTITGQMEMRGLGIFSVKPAKPCPLALVVDLQPAATIERMPEPEDLLTTLLGQQVPRIMLDASQPAAASILRLAFVQMC
jgi:serine kinase of HPr protein (carbohydrate metabolism regulator)